MGTGQDLPCSEKRYKNQGWECDSQNRGCGRGLRCNTRVFRHGVCGYDGAYDDAYDDNNYDAGDYEEDYDVDSNGDYMEYEELYIQPPPPVGLLSMEVGLQGFRFRFQPELGEEVRCVQARWLLYWAMLEVEAAASGRGDDCNEGI